MRFARLGIFDPRGEVAAGLSVVALDSLVDAEEREEIITAVGTQPNGSAAPFVSPPDNKQATTTALCRVPAPCCLLWLLHRMHRTR